jgi:16S rRNA (guanine966-N2)-methyltransferase
MKVRIVGGKHRGTLLRVSERQQFRPSMDRVRETVFNILMHRYASENLIAASVIDVFAGSGAYGFEALSRGAKHATFIDINGQALSEIRTNANKLSEVDHITLIKSDACSLRKPPSTLYQSATIVFLDPPYGKELVEPALAGLAARRWLNVNALCVVETSIQDVVTAPRNFHHDDERNIGTAKISFLKYEKPQSTFQ